MRILKPVKRSCADSVTMRNCIRAMLGMSVILAAATVRADIIQSTLSTIPSYPAFVPSIAVGNQGDVAQVITAPISQGLFLTSFQVELASGGLTAVKFRGAVYQFNPTKLAVVGLPLYTSEILSAAPLITNNYQYQLFTFDTGDIPVTSGGSYALVLQQDNLGNTTNYQLPVTATDVYPGGEILEITAISSPFPNLSTDNTIIFPGTSTRDLAFSADFATPLPATAPAAIVLLLAVLAWHCRRALQKNLVRGR